jgi:hypothetical protein
LNGCGRSWSNAAVDFNDAHRCRVCGERFDNHATANNPVRPFGCPGKKFPTWPKSIRNEAKAGALYDKRIAKFWRERKSTFSPVS